MHCVTRSILNNVDKVDLSLLSYLNFALIFINSRLEEIRNDLNASASNLCYGVN
jgi:hypothetical protein